VGPTDAAGGAAAAGHALSTLAISAAPAAAQAALPVPLAGGAGPMEWAAGSPASLAASATGLPVYAAAGPGAPLPPGYNSSAEGAGVAAAAAVQPPPVSRPQAVVGLDLGGEVPPGHAPASAPAAGCKPGLNLS
jgi:hypothetical protein